MSRCYLKECTGIRKNIRKSFKSEKSVLKNSITDKKDMHGMFSRHKWLHEKELFFLLLFLQLLECWIRKKIRKKKSSSDIPGIGNLLFVPWIKMESTLENGCLSSALCHTPQRKGRSGGEVSHVHGKCTDPGGLRFQLMTPRLDSCDDKIPTTI